MDMMTDVHTTSSSKIATNETQFDYGSQAFYITWYILAGSIGLVGNIFVLVVYCNAQRLQTARLVVSWLAFVDLIGCLTFPFRYLILFQADKLSRPLCIAIPLIIAFSINLTTFSLVVAAIERYRKVRFFNKQYRNDTIIYVIIVFSVLIALGMAAASRLHVQLDTHIGDAFRCEPINHKSFFESPDPMWHVLRIFISLIMFCCIVIITILYIKISLLLRRRIGIPRTQQLPDCSPNTEHNAAPLEEQNEDIYSSQDECWREVVLTFNSPEEQNETSCELHKNDTNPNLNMQPVADIDDIMPKIESTIMTIPVLSEKSQDSVPTSRYFKNDIWTSSVSRSSSASRPDTIPASIILSSHKFKHGTSNSRSNVANLSTQAKPASISKVELESRIVKCTPLRSHVASILYSSASFNLSQQQLPGVVLEDENIFSINHPPVSPRDVSELSTRNQELSIPTLESDERNNHLIGRNLITKTTLMLFIATVMFIVTYGLFITTVLLLDINKVSHFFMEFVLINHFINPFVYNFVNESFKDECRAFLQKLKSSKCVQRKPVLTDG